MRAESIASTALIFGILIVPASAQYGGGFAPPKQAPPPPAVTPPVPPAPPAQVPAPQDEEEEEPEVTPPQTTPTVPDTKDPQPAARRFDCTAPEKAWLARLDNEDRQAIEASLGYALPVPASDVQWLGQHTTPPDLSDKVVIIQTIDAGSSSTGPLDQIMSALATESDSASIVVVGVQIPNKIEAATTKLGKSKSKAHLCIDTKGAWCDELGAFRKPVNFVIDRSGAIRYAGLTPRGTVAAAKLLVSEAKSSDAPMAKPKSDSTTPSTAASFPTYTQPLNGCTDLRGKPSPELLVDQWVTQQPNTTGKLIIVDFFFTGCAPCRAAIPHMNDMVAHYGDKIAVVGVSFESKSTFDSGMTRYKLKTRDFHYALGLDTSRRTVGAFGVQSFPCCAIISADGIVRWQGHPGGLNESVLDPLVAANEAVAKTMKKSDSKSRGWAKVG